MKELFYEVMQEAKEGKITLEDDEFPIAFNTIIYEGESQMKIYIGHNKEINYQEELYRPIMENKYYQDPNYTFFFPHQLDRNSQNDRVFYEDIDIFFAEVSYPSTGLGIELGYAADSQVPIILLIKKGITPNTSSKTIATDILEYTSPKDLKEKIEFYIASLTD